MKPFPFFGVGLLCLSTMTAKGVMFFFDQVTIDFAATNSPRVECLRKQQLEIASSSLKTNNGGTWLAAGGSFTTSPMGLGLSWRSTAIASVSVDVRPTAVFVPDTNAVALLNLRRDVYVRYSPDFTHWSTWQALQKVSQTTNGFHFEGLIEVPQRQRAEYGKLISTYSSLDVPWRSDEEAVVKWILSRDPDFLEKHLPFIGYVQFLYEGDFIHDQPIHSFKAKLSYGTSGLHVEAKDPKAAENRDVPWRFKPEMLKED
jgi:hypothetical protein